MITDILDNVIFEATRYLPFRCTRKIRRNNKIKSFNYLGNKEMLYICPPFMFYALRRLLK